MAVSVTIQKWWVLTIVIVGLGIGIGIGIGILFLFAKTVWGAEISQASPVPETEPTSIVEAVPSTPGLLSSGEVENTLSPHPGPVSSVAQPAQQNLSFVDSLAVAEESASLATAPREWPKIDVEWSEPFRINSLQDLPPVEKGGFYRGNAQNTGTPEALAYLQKIQPQLTEGTRCCLVMAAVARDPVDKNVVFATFWVDFPAGVDVPVGTKIDSYGYIFLSIDGEKTWQQISYISSSGWDIPLDVRVRVVSGTTLTLLVRDRNFVAPMWRETILSLKDLP